MRCGPKGGRWILPGNGFGGGATFGGGGARGRGGGGGGGPGGGGAGLPGGGFRGGNGPPAVLSDVLASPGEGSFSVFAGILFTKSPLVLNSLLLEFSKPVDFCEEPVALQIQ